MSNKSHILTPNPNRRAEFWADSDGGPAFIYSFKAGSYAEEAVARLAAVWLERPNYCVNICSLPADEDTP